MFSFFLDPGGALPLGLLNFDDPDPDRSDSTRVDGAAESDDLPGGDAFKGAA